MQGGAHKPTPERISRLSCFHKDSNRSPFPSENFAGRYKKFSAFAAVLVAVTFKISGLARLKSSCAPDIQGLVVVFMKLSIRVGDR